MLSDYFATLEKARITIKQRLAYPLFLLHFGVFVMGSPEFITKGAHTYLLHTVGFLAALWIAAALVFIGIRKLLHAATGSAPLDRLLLGIPFFGKLRRAFSLARFCATYDMQLEAGINVIDSLTSASAASGSAAITEVLNAAMPDIHAGSQVGPLLRRSRLFPDEMIRAWRVGEETGGLDKELQKLTADYEDEAFRRMEIFSEWMTKIIYIVITLYLGYEIVSLYSGYLRKVNEITNGSF
jgi:type IV pilus assembly protein PilC